MNVMIIKTVCVVQFANAYCKNFDYGSRVTIDLEGLHWVDQDVKSKGIGKVTWNVYADKIPRP